MKDRIQEYNSRFAELSVAEVISCLAQEFPAQVKFSSAFGQEDQVITDIIFRNQLPVEVFTLDTGRLFSETYELMEKTRMRYKPEITTYFPKSEDVEPLVSEKGFFSFYESVENRKECCYIRKVAPLKRALRNTKVWITGMRAAQSDNRQHLDLFEWDEGNQVIKYNPILNWTYEAMLAYLDEYKVPYNTLHDKGFVSIGCQPCTRSITPDESPRAGRWWWESSQKECGLHTVTIKR
ncbi:phosphoadenylyl-sulfate reductase [Roseivirga sp.]|uniref:phosphoadenylyl-sulfate reductase n=1 Tax=Roseivirga sp. TaxID=1964215 RepID=UPI002B26CC7C|nr:phosphoadenylyl-sulfate reductase [Roseivirga sp.]